MSDAERIGVDGNDDVTGLLDDMHKDISGQVNPAVQRIEDGLLNE